MMTSSDNTTGLSTVGEAVTETITTTTTGTPGWIDWGYLGPDDAASGSLTPEDTSWMANFTKTDASQLAARTAFLGLFIVVAFVGNCVLIATVSQSKRLRRSMFNIFIINMAVVNLLDCVLNMPLILGTTVKEEWEFGHFICKLNACGIQLVSTERLFSLTVMVFDRCVAILDSAKYFERMSRFRVNMIITYSWVQSILFAHVILYVTTIPSKLYPSRYLCSIGESTLAYIATTSVVCFIIPFIAIVMLYFVIIKKCVAEKLQNKMMLQNHQYTDSALDEPVIWREVRGAIYVGILVILWGIFEGPFLCINYIEQFQKSVELKPTSTLSVSYPYEIELVFTWMRMSYPICLPFATFFWRKEIWQKFKDLILCRKSNLVVDVTPRVEKEKEKEKEREKKLLEKEAMMLNASSSFNAPVLFATANGLHVRMFVNGEEDEMSESQGSVLGDNLLLAQEVIKTSRSQKCDVDGSAGTVNKIPNDEDTSDYDSQSELDPFSVSNPVSVKSIEKSHDRQKSNSSNSTSSTSREVTENADNKVKEMEMKQILNASGRQKTRKKSQSSAAVEKLDLGEVTEGASKVDEAEDAKLDSGRGTGESSNKKRRPKLETTDCPETRLPKDREVSKNGAKETHKQDVTVDISNASDSPNLVSTAEVKKPRPKKKKKTKILVHEEKVEMSSVKETNNIDPGIPMSRRPPPRLKPLDHLPKSDNSVPSILNNLESDLTLQRSPVDSITGNQVQPNGNIVSKETANHEPDQEYHTKPNSLEKPAKVKANRTKPRQSSLSPDEPKKKKNRRHNSCDSESSLLQMSSNSDDIRNLKALAEEEEVKMKKRSKSESQQDLLDGMSPR
ncbi:uncharacterized protein LOC106165696 [Lingula anatina]|uniref:Uncharacterized protein LOC106165696 n=1 Tax=Lingula anatina TaxID=7574 RepID=A0A1S3IPI4_LINAN|nr:uncharacterized protein LOC106165696 [Lingula anatina]|eukprot:XP_013399454.1 uncharacterized protein LOC106165696 [Lingula anatina]